MPSHLVLAAELLGLSKLRTELLGPRPLSALSLESKLSL